MCSKEFNTDDDWAVPPGYISGEFGSLVPEEFYAVPTLEAGKKYKIEYVASFNESAGMLDILPQSVSEFTIYDISCVEIIPKIVKENELVPKGMSPSYFHILSKQKKGKR